MDHRDPGIGMWPLVMEFDYEHTEIGTTFQKWDKFFTFDIMRLSRKINGNYYPNKKISKKTDVWNKPKKLFDKAFHVSKKSGFVYVINMDGTNFYKIGTSINVEKRIGSIKTNNPFDIIVIFKIHVNGCFAVEKSIHQTFIDKKHRGEWYKLSEVDIHYIKEFCASVKTDTQ